ncbi:3-isopropylmalate dehydrogenase [Bacteroidetes bacterium endosymbiont of Geopemphigus sp.]|uniref:3-isopropylmalate dehydrogenase n=1 Tax=Bacteroidetes bacterium endosymbiont of Geopemphigus sp. TaxID=2047937 RepID=UPI000CD14BD3|nr:3-isopropylmalate dehydrogenase [Bacteroidetes bacterium endosymbiont of Geopemphigus sp.]
MNKKIALLAGDGIGPEITRQAVKVLDAIAQKFKHDFIYRRALAGAAAIAHTGSPMPEETLDICLDSDAVLFGAIGDPKYDDDPNTKVRPEQGLLKIRKSLGLYCNIRPITAYEALLDRSPLKKENIKGVDFVIYRELTGGIYFGEKARSSHWAYDQCSYSANEIERIAHAAFKATLARRKKLTLVDKANVLETSRLWRELVKKIAEDYPEVGVDFLFVDNAAMQIILKPFDFDVLLTENMFGDILSDEAGVITGSIGLSPSASVGEKNALFEPVHGSYPQAAGKNIANPLACILSAAMMLDYLGLSAEARAVRKAVDYSINHGKSTIDICSKQAMGTEEVGDFLVKELFRN